MYIIDREGKRIEVTDHNAAIKQVERFLNLVHTQGDYAELDESLGSYWRDIYEKLLALL
jgi:hypothetical protein